jgi:hypothetical protein
VFHRLTPSGRHAVALARAEAHHLGHDRLEAVHVLLGVLRLVVERPEEAPALGAALAHAGTDPAAIRAEVEAGLSPGPEERADALPLDGSARRVLERAVALASASRPFHPLADVPPLACVGAEHLFLALLDLDDDLPTPVLRLRAVFPTSAREALRAAAGLRARSASDGFPGEAAAPLFDALGAFALRRAVRLASAGGARVEPRHVLAGALQAARTDRRWATRLLAVGDPDVARTDGAPPTRSLDLSPETLELLSRAFAIAAREARNVVGVGDLFRSLVETDGSSIPVLDALRAALSEPPL